MTIDANSSRSFGVSGFTSSLGASAGRVSKASGGTDMRSHLPRFQSENLDKNVALVDALRSIADAKKVTVAQIAIAWVLHRGVDVVPIVGSRTRKQLADSLGALNVALDAADMAAIEAAVPKNAVAGDRYTPQMMEQLDSERR